MMLADATASSNLLSVIRRRPALDALGQSAYEAIAAQGDPDLTERWAEAVLALIQANAGIACISAMLRLRGPGKALGEIADFAVEVCRHAGSAATNACLDTWDRLRAESLWPGFVRLAREAPESLSLATKNAASIIDAVGGDGFLDFVAVGLKAAGRDKAARAAFFALTSPIARQALARGSGDTLAAHERGLKLFVAALWGRVPVIRPLPTAPGRAPNRRASQSDGIMLVPDAFPGVPQQAQHALYRAATAHLFAHLSAAAPRQPVGTLKPLQLALVGLIEDARVETLALRRFPGLRRLWARYHVAQPEGVTVPALLARMTRALFDASYQDSHGWVMKARELVAEADPLDPSASRRIGGLLGNDLGQMRVQFNSRTYVIEPAYRDDNLGLWDFGASPEMTPDVQELMIEAARLRQETGEGRVDQNADGDSGTARARPASAPREAGTILAHYPEWDRAQGIERPDWTCVHDVSPRLGDVRTLAAALDATPDLRRRIDRLVRAARAGEPYRLKRQPDGVDLDMDAVLDAEVARQAGELPDEGVYRGSPRRSRDLATAVLVDISESTRHDGILETERLAVALLSEAMARLGDPFALLAFASDGREQVRLTRIKDFAEPFGVLARARLAGLAPGLSTRLGAALRHTGSELHGEQSHRRLVLVLTDGEPSDIDVPDPLDLVEDSRRAVMSLRSRGMDVFAVVLGMSHVANAARMFGRSGYVALRRVEDLPSRLADLYFRLSRR